MPTRWQTFPIEVAGGLISNLPDVQQGLNMLLNGIVLKLQALLLIFKA